MYCTSTTVPPEKRGFDNVFLHTKTFNMQSCHAYITIHRHNLKIEQLYIIKDWILLEIWDVEFPKHIINW
jgi:hypothetical protein